jgi:hypothetical protein
LSLPLLCPIDPQQTRFRRSAQSFPAACFHWRGAAGGHQCFVGCPR